MADFRRALVIAVGWQAAMTVFGYVLDLTAYKFVRPPGTSLLAHMQVFDGYYYYTISQHWYREPADFENWLMPAFFPAFPFFIRLVRLLTFNLLGTLAAGLVVNTIALWLSVAALVKIAREFRIGKPWLVVAAFLTAAPALFLHTFYSEATFIALGCWAYLFALRGQWAFMALCLIPLTATRVTAAAFVLLCFLEFFRSVDWRPWRLLSWRLLWFPVGFLGFAAYAWYLKATVGDPLGMFAVYKEDSIWKYHVFNPNIAETLSAAVGHLWDGTNSFVGYVLPLAGLAMLLAASVYVMVVLRGRGVPLGLFGLASFVMLTINSNVVSVHRYVLPCIVLYLAAVLAVERRPVLRPGLYGLMYAGAMIQGLLFFVFVGGAFAG